MLQFSSSSQLLKEKAAFSCKACQLTFASVFHLSSHVQSQLHKVNISQMKKRRVAISNPIWCELCRSSCSSLGEVEAHPNGSRHNSLLSSLARELNAVLVHVVWAILPV
ncbi:putative transcription factor C2H2 family [Helianthus anomalus]